MPRNRHSENEPKEKDLIVRSLGLGLPADYQIKAHRHDWHQLVYATEGVMTVETEPMSWIVPPERAVWISAGTKHAVRAKGRVTMRTVYLRPDFVTDHAASIPLPCGVIHVSPLLRELVLETLRVGMLDGGRLEQRNLGAVLINQISGTSESSLHLPLPRDARARRVCKKARTHLSRDIPLAQLARGSGASPRTIERLMVRETGMTFGRWLQRMKALQSLEELAAGESVTQAALSVGYDSTSAYIAMFKRVFGTTPGSYFADS